MTLSIIVVAKKNDMTDFRSIVDMKSDTETFVIVANTDNANSIGSVVGQTLQIETRLSFSLSNNLVSHREVTTDNIINLGKKLSDLLFGWSLRE